MAPYTTIIITLFLQLITFAAGYPPPGATYPIYKDATDTHKHYYTTLQIGTPPKSANFTLTLSSQLLRYICQNDNFTSTTYRPVPCTSNTCLVSSRGFTSCRSCDEPKPRPGCTNDTCTVPSWLITLLMISKALKRFTLTFYNSTTQSIVSYNLVV
ncbi:hypothetical protein QQ045_006736 [Rhodiola kirilowii]